MPNNSVNDVFIETEPYEKGFAEYYSKNLKPHIKSFEDSRQQVMKRLRGRAIKLGLILLGIIIFFPIILTIILFVPAVIATYITVIVFIIKARKEFKESVQQKLLPIILSFYGNFNFSYKCENRLTALSDFDIIPNYDIENSENQIKGIYKGVDIDFFRTTLLSGNNKIATYAFNGLFINYSMHKNFNGKTIVRKDGLVADGIIGDHFKAKLADLDKVTLEDNKFEKTFDVYSSDQVEARYLLTPSFMERLIQLNEFYNTQKMELCFYKDILLIKIPLEFSNPVNERDLFDTGSIFQPINFANDTKKILKEMQLIFQIIETLKLDQNIGM